MCRATNKSPMGTGEDLHETGDPIDVQNGSSKRKQRRVSFAPKNQHACYYPVERQDSNTGGKSYFCSQRGGKSGSHRCIALIVIAVISLCVSLCVSTYARRALLSITSPCGGSDAGQGNIKALHVLKQSSKASHLADMRNETNRPIATFLFLVGVEGSGHHLWRSVYSASPSYRRYRKAQGEYNLAEPFIQMTRGLSSLFTAGCEGDGIDLGDDDTSSNDNAEYDLGNQTSVVTDGTIQQSSNLTQAFDDVVRGMRRIKGLLRRKYGSKHNTAVAINAFFRKLNRGKFFSYPFGQEDGCRTTSYPDLDLLYHACYEARVECKHILITRDAYEVIRSTTVNRHFSAVGQQIKTMSSMMDVIRIQNVDHHESLAACWDFDTADGGGIGEISDLLGWESQEAFRASYSELLNQPESLGEEEIRAVVPDDLQEVMLPYVQQTKRTADECQSLLKLKSKGANVGIPT